MFYITLIEGSGWVYSNWNSGQPDNSPGESDCMNLADYYGYKWDDVWCECYSNCYDIYAACMAPCAKPGCAE